METKVSSRDKMLLIILAIIVLIFGAVMLPTVGIKDLISSISEASGKITVQKAENAELMAQLGAVGIAGYGENLNGAKDALRQDILESKYGAIKTQQNSLSIEANEKNAYAVADNWLLPVKYLHFDSGNTKLYASVAVTNNEGAFSDEELAVGESYYSVQNFNCTFSCTADSDERYTLDLEYINNDLAIDQMSLLIATYDVLCERGSVTITSWTFNDTGISMTLELTIPDDSHIADYAAEIGECHTCGNPYYLADYYNEAKTGDVKCNQCESLLTGEAMQ